MNATTARSDDATENYLANGFNGRLGHGREPALLVVDFVEAYLDPTSPMYAAVENERDCGARILKAARDAGIPVLFTKVEFQDETDGGLFVRKIAGLKAMTQGSELGRITSALAPLQGEPVLRKKYASSFFGTTLASDLRLLGCDEVIIIGLSTSGCVRATAVDAMQHGFIAQIVADAVGDRHPAPHQAALFDLDAKYADVVSEAEILAYIQQIRKRSRSTPVL
jgi:maleamate amidohydrolase